MSRSLYVHAMMVLIVVMLVSTGSSTLLAAPGDETPIRAAWLNEVPEVVHGGA